MMTTYELFRICLTLITVFAMGWLSATIWGGLRRNKSDGQPDDEFSDEELLNMSADELAAVVNKKWRESKEGVEIEMRGRRIAKSFDKWNKEGDAK